MFAITFESNHSAARVDASLRQSLKAMEDARQCAVLWFAEVMCRRLLPALAQERGKGGQILKLGL